MQHQYDHEVKNQIEFFIAEVSWTSIIRILGFHLLMSCEFMNSQSNPFNFQSWIYFFNQSSNYYCDLTDLKRPKGIIKTKSKILNMIGRYIGLDNCCQEKNK